MKKSIILSIILGATIATSAMAGPGLRLGGHFNMGGGHSHPVVVHNDFHFGHPGIIPINGERFNGEHHVYGFHAWPDDRAHLGWPAWYIGHDRCYYDWYDLDGVRGTVCTAQSENGMSFSANADWVAGSGLRFGSTENAENNALESCNNTGAPGCFLVGCNPIY